MQALSCPSTPHPLTGIICYLPHASPTWGLTPTLTLRRTHKTLGPDTAMWWASRGG